MSKKRHNQQRTPSRQSAKKPTLAQLRRKVEKQPRDPAGWKALGEYYANQKEWHSALEPLEHALKLAPQDPAVLELMGRTEHGLGNNDQALTLLEKALTLAPDNTQVLFSLSRLHYGRAQDKQALEYVNQALDLAPNNLVILTHKGNVLARLHRYNEAFDVFRSLIKTQPDQYIHWNNAGNQLRDLGELNEALTYYQKADELSGSSAVPFSNHLTLLHYLPQVKPESIYQLSMEWEARFAPSDIPKRPVPLDTAPNKRLRIGMISDGFRSHPVGKMITAALEKLEAHQFGLYAYSTNNAIDPITLRIRNVTKQWMAIPHLSDEALAQQIRDDQIDILIDLAGHNTGSRMRVMAMQPAPLQVKWVGGLINTTGLNTIDYLISDAIETPQGSDDSYVEKLIRMPDDYICYEPPSGVPDVGELPASRNGYITLGCFNNAAKVNDVVLVEWAKVMHQLPDSRLFLKSFQYNSQDLCDKIRRVMAEQGIEAERLIIEGSSPHLELMEAYNRVDIALDPWPYSGGLTTCEAFVMGVPVVTLPGPTFAGRHSATHLVNAGMPELVVNSWEEYRQRVLGLAADLESLSTIRQHLREVLLQSPVCDAPRFAKHFTTAMRAIWQRYCEGKQPAALTLNQEGEAQFEDDEQPIELAHPEPLEEAENGFSWQLPGKIIAIDNSARLLQQDSLAQLRRLKAFGIVAFDPASRVENPGQYQGSDDVQVFPHAVLGDGQPGTLYACLDPALSSTLEPLPNEQQFGANAQGAQVLTKLPINTIALDSINGLDSLDWLILDDLSDAATILEHGQKALQNTLLIQVRIAFQPTHQRQPNLAEMQHWMARHGFRFYRFNDQQHRSHLPESVPEAQRQASELVSADATFLPSHERMAQLSDEQRTKLAFLLHTVFGVKDMAYGLLDEVNKEEAEAYLMEEGLAKVKLNDLNTRNLYEPSIESLQAVGDTVSQEIDALLEINDEKPKTGLAERMISNSVAVTSLEEKKHKPINLWELDEPIHVVDIGANPIDGTPPYAELLKSGLVELVGFEPQADALKKLQAIKGRNETYLPHAVGTGKRTKLYLCHASGMTSTLKPNNQVLNHFQGYPIWGRVKSVEEIDTIRLDDVEEIKKIDWLKIDIQGGELAVFENGENRLKDTLVIQTEVNFIQLYEKQPLFSEIDQWMRAHGFMLHTLLEQRRRLYAPMKINGGIHQGINQLTTADAVYVKDINCLKSISEERIKKMAFILSKAYGSYDLAYRLMMNTSGFDKRNFFKKVVGKNTNGLSVS